MDSRAILSVDIALCTGAILQARLDSLHRIHVVWRPDTSTVFIDPGFYEPGLLQYGLASAVMSAWGA